MTFPKKLGLFVVLAALLCAPSARCETGEPPRRVIFVLVDTLRADHLHYMGYERETSPTMDKLASESVDFRYAIAQGDGTAYSMPALFTSKYYSQLFANPPSEGGIPSENTTIPELFQAAGFKTLGWSTNPHVSRDWHFDQGFDQFYELLPANTVYSRIEHVIRMIRRSYRASGEREFLYVHLMDVHSPYFPPGPYHRMWSSSYTRKQFAEGRMLGVDQRQAISLLPYWAENHDVQAEDVARAVAEYDGEIRYLNDYFPELLKALHYKPEQDALVITADHGEQFYETQFLGHNKSTLLEEIHVPLLIRIPEAAPRQVTTPVALADVLPTLCDLYGFAPPADIQGRSLMPAIRGEDLQPRPLFSEGSPERGPVGVVFNKGLLYYLGTQCNAQLFPWEVWPIQQFLFDVEKDPSCVHNLFDTRPEDAKEMNALLRGLNPRFVNATPEQLAGSEKEVNYGPELIPPREEDKPIALGAGTGDFRVSFTVADGGKAHAIEFSYILGNASLSVEARSATGSPAMFYRYTFFKPRKEKRAFRVVLFPPAGEVTLSFHLKGKGSAALSGLRCRRVFAPEIAIAPWPDAPQYNEAPPELTDDETKRLEALGYLN